MLKYIILLLIVHIIFSLLFRRLAKVNKVKGWGIVYDFDDKKPVKKVIARLFNVSLNKLVSTQVTDRKGRYYFLAGDGKYYVTFEHKNYNSQQTEDIDLQGNKGDVITKEIGLKKIDKDI